MTWLHEKADWFDLATHLVKVHGQDIEKMRRHSRNELAAIHNGFESMPDPDPEGDVMVVEVRLFVEGRSGTVFVPRDLFDDPPALATQLRRMLTTLDYDDDSPPPPRIDVDRGLLAEAIVRIGVAAGITRGDVPLTGPELLLLADELVRSLEALGDALPGL